jgi:hypothetical protein
MSLQKLRDLRAELMRSEGVRIFKEIRRIQASLRLLRGNYEELDDLLTTLEQAQQIRRLRDDHVRDEAFELVLRRVHNFVAAAFSLVDHSRAHRKHLYLGHEFDAEIGRELDNRVRKHPHDSIGKGLRRYCLHFALPNISHSVQIGSSGTLTSTFFALPSESLLELEEWNQQAKTALMGMPNGLIIRPFASEYFHQIEGFYAWLWRRQEEVHKSELDIARALEDKVMALQGQLFPDNLPS